MKKVLMLAVMVFGLTITACGAGGDNGAKEGEKYYNYENFKAYLKKQNLSFSYTKCIGVSVKNDKKTETKYTYESDGAWHYTITQNLAGETYTTEAKAYLDIRSDMSGLDYTAKQAKTTVDKIYKFYVILEGGYRMTGNYEYDDIATEFEYIYNEKGLVISKHLVMDDHYLKSSTTTDTTYTYSK